MWWIAIPVVAGAAAWILDELGQEAGNEKKRWEDKRHQVKNDLGRHQIEIQSHLNKAQTACNFHLLVQKHYESVKVSDQAYKLLSDVKISLNAVGRAIGKAKAQRDALIKKRQRSNDRLHKQELTREIDSLVLLRKQLFAERDEMLIQKEEIYCKVKLLNNQTQKLKHTIRDTTGYKGKQWYAPLEFRKAQKNPHSF